MMRKTLRLHYDTPLRPGHQALAVFVVLLAFVISAWGQQSSGTVTEKAGSSQPGIQDNSFLMEEAYNQEPGVVQHISNGLFFSQPQKNLFFSFTQEWPLGGQSHQLSFTLPYSFQNSNSSRGIGDILVNYRYQLVSNETWAVAPRLSFILPTGNVNDGFGNGVVGLQAAVPVSKQLTDQFVAHVNVGLTLLPNVAAQGTAAKRTILSEYAGASIVWLGGTNVNVLLESIVSHNGMLNANGELEHELEAIVNPGLRFAINLGGLQIVPGIAVPIDFQKQQTRVGIFLYLSFEHPF